MQSFDFFRSGVPLPSMNDRSNLLKDAGNLINCYLISRLEALSIIASWGFWGVHWPFSFSPYCFLFPQCICDCEEFLIQIALFLHSLNSFASRGALLPATQVDPELNLRFVLQMASGLQYLHSHVC